MAMTQDRDVHDEIAEIRRHLDWIERVLFVGAAGTTFLALAASLVLPFWSVVKVDDGLDDTESFWLLGLPDSFSEVYRLSATEDQADQTVGTLPAAIAIMAIIAILLTLVTRTRIVLGHAGRWARVLQGCAVGMLTLTTLILWFLTWAYGYRDNGTADGDRVNIIGLGLVALTVGAIFALLSIALDRSYPISRGSRRLPA